MGLFSKLFSKKESKRQLEEQKLFYAQQNEKMERAYAQAKQTFNYFWRELYWEYRRIVPALDLSIVKIPFEQKFETIKEPVVEHMWINQIDFDGENISGILMNSPNRLTNISKGDSIIIPLDKISDWMFAIRGKTYGGFTIQMLRSDMEENERAEHDKAWGLDFGDYNDIQTVFEQKVHPENLIEHPMSKNMKGKVRSEYLKGNFDGITSKDENGLTMLHNETIAGNKTIIDVLLKIGIDKEAKTNTGKTALDYAKSLNWEHIIPVLK
ncbi:DUF2314 domain-containing protein [Aquimarina longa]|uniref:DUF2314 domain-containing protein n=1 Tax=Aquimarina longa TaxID=1080221 RepID=UPI0007812921|nr:DUF2314 domain-containing protein [Aquimarina longa]